MSAYMHDMKVFWLEVALSMYDTIMLVLEGYKDMPKYSEHMWLVERYVWFGIASSTFHGSSALQYDIMMQWFAERKHIHTVF